MPLLTLQKLGILAELLAENERVDPLPGGKSLGEIKKMKNFILSIGETLIM